ncbi:TIGR02300 family protein [Sabulicella glaciei]|uniref:TIGR02300 family protein n=1 Tax=Sabulicella glaciei TaxID=2984948 RepID=A0ABT3NVI3_9PROT|nr:TIGR02300 family protein [Roseococcus sp. MDT2-1-1]MCW8086180.1 TIGR02300 family protein [Roseococcus sp. MDT2-1-1]
MAKPELGLKRVCVSCSTKFYDLTKQPAICPKCGAEQPAEQPRLRRPAAPLPEDKVKKRGAAAEADTDEVELDDVDAEAGIEDADELEDEDETIDADIEVEGERDEEG